MSFEKFISSFSQKYLDESMDESIENIIYTDEEAKILLPKTSFTFINHSSSQSIDPCIKIKVTSYYFTASSLSITGRMTLHTSDLYSSMMKDTSFSFPVEESIEVHQPDLQLYKTLVNFIPGSSSINQSYASQYKIKSNDLMYDLDLSDAKYIHYVDAASEIKCFDSQTKVYLNEVNNKGYDFDIYNSHQFIFQNIHLTKERQNQPHLFFKYIQSPSQVKCIFEGSCPYIQCPLCTGKKLQKVLPEVITDQETIMLHRQFDHDEKNIIKYVKEGKDKVMYIKSERPKETIYGKYVWYENKWIKI
jgi:hypothetical protein